MKMSYEIRWAIYVCLYLLSSLCLESSEELHYGTVSSSEIHDGCYSYRMLSGSGVWLLTWLDVYCESARAFCSFWRSVLFISVCGAG